VRAISASTPDTRASGPFRTWNGRDSWEFVDGVRLHAIGGEQVLMCRVQYAPGKQVSWHKHDDTEQLMFIIEGEVEMTIEQETATLRPGDVVTVNRGLHHKLYSEHGVVFIEALAPVPLDHVPDRELDLVLGPDGGATHVES
jgi:quercetin dioxygenase-like cupin family protein